MKYFRINDVLDVRNRWHLGSPCTSSGQEIDPRAFTQGIPFETTDDICIPVTQGTVEMEFTLGSFEMPIVSVELARCIEAHSSGAVQRIPVAIPGTRSAFEIINVLNIIDCLDETNSEITRWTAEDGRPDKVGQLFGIHRIALRAETLGDAAILRIRGWELPVVISDRMKEVLQTHRPSGVSFEELSVV